MSSLGEKAVHFRAPGTFNYGVVLVEPLTGKWTSQMSKYFSVLFDIWDVVCPQEMENSEFWK